MGVAIWIAIYAMLSALCFWIVFRSGADSVAGLVTAVFLGADVVRWSEDGIRLFVGATWGLLTLWFVLGLLFPDARLGI